MELYMIGIFVGLIAGLILGRTWFQELQMEAAKKRGWIIIEGKIYALTPAKAVKDE